MNPGVSRTNMNPSVHKKIWFVFVVVNLFLLYCMKYDSKYSSYEQFLEWIDRRIIHRNWYRIRHFVSTGSYTWCHIALYSALYSLYNMVTCDYEKLNVAFYIFLCVCIYFDLWLNISTIIAIYHTFISNRMVCLNHSLSGKL